MEATARSPPAPPLGCSRTYNNFEQTISLIAIILQHICSKFTILTIILQELTDGDFTTISPTMISNKTLTFKNNIEFHPSGKI